MPPMPLKRLLMTGAAGGLGRELRARLAPFAERLRLSDLAPLAATPAPHEEDMPCDLADKAGMRALLADVDAVVHFGGVSVERPFEQILEANLRGVFHLYEAARLQGVRRIVFASSNHTIGFYRQGERIDTSAKQRPDSYYGVSKCFGEDMAQMYFERYGIETVSIRIGSALPEPQNRRQLSTWISHRDLVNLIGHALFTPGVGHTIVYGASASRDTWWDNSGASVLGWAPLDSSEPYRAAIEAQPPLADDDPNGIYQGGFFVNEGPFD
ncbi:NAD(P)-dependent oxidoreductase [Pelomonas sp. KK5]|uniref:NAD-dependent epimerase/dehydratase family protein n=1 Tax=Pelomonas sp. KK5 TaxID=1855730 RepID=UPI00097BAB8A|nr:NAD(P)-dependent oxidoreductase [Pelomonas sp. KK5]